MAAGEEVSVRHDDGLVIGFGRMGSEGVEVEVDLKSGAERSSGEDKAGGGVEGVAGTVVVAASVPRALPLTTAAHDMSSLLKSLEEVITGVRNR